MKIGKYGKIQSITAGYCHPLRFNQIKPVTVNDQSHSDGAFKQKIGF